MLCCSMSGKAPVDWQPIRWTPADIPGINRAPVSFWLMQPMFLASAPRSAPTLAMKTAV
jgi:hypothetical protein